MDGDNFCFFFLVFLHFFGTFCLSSPAAHSAFVWTFLCSIRHLVPLFCHFHRSSLSFFHSFIHCCSFVDNFHSFSDVPSHPLLNLWISCNISNTFSISLRSHHATFAFVGTSKNQKKKFQQNFRLASLVMCRTSPPLFDVTMEANETEKNNFFHSFNDSNNFLQNQRNQRKNKNRTKTRENYKYERHREKFKEHGKSSTKCKPVVKSTIDWKYSTGCDNDFRLFRITFTSQRACGNIMKCLALVWFSNNNK